jgi:hypothetical protein
VFLAVLNRIIIRVSQALKVRGGNKGLRSAPFKAREGRSPEAFKRKATFFKQERGP